MQADKTSFLLQDFLNSEFLSDITLIHDPASAPADTAPVQYKAHRIVLAAGSKFLKERFQKNPQISRVILPVNQDSATLSTFIKYLYTNQDNQLFEIISLSHAPTLFQLQTIAHELQCEKLKNSLQKYILEDYLSGATASGVLLHGIKLNDKDLIEAGKKVLIDNFDNVLENEDQGSGIDALVKLPFDVFRQICTADVLNVKEQASVVKAVTQFIRKRDQLPLLVEQQKKEQAPSAPPPPPSGQDQEAPERESDPPAEPAEGEEAKRQQNQEEKFKASEKQANESIHTLINRFQERTKMRRLTDNDKLQLFKQIRYSHLSHQTLIRLSTQSLFTLAKDYVLQGLSARLKSYEGSSEETLEINYSQQPRESYKLPHPEQQVTHMSQANEQSKIIQQQQLQQQQHPTAPPSQHPARSTPRTASLYHQHPQNMLPSHHASPSQPQQQSSQSFYSKNKGFNLAIPNKSLGNSIFKQSIPRPPQKLGANTGQSGFPFGGQSLNLAGNSQQQLPIYFEYQYDFDQNGALYYLGSYGRKRLWQNPHTIGQVRVLASSVGSGKVQDFVGRNAQNLRTMNEQCSFFGVDLGQGRLFTPTYYSIRNRKATSHVMMNWKMEASLDKVDWKTLDIRQHIFPPNSQFDDVEIRAQREALKISGATSTWGLDTNLVNDEAFRYFRIVQTYKNSSGSDNLALSGFQLYGVAKAGRWH